jgi:hypothetical protein
MLINQIIRKLERYDLRDKNVARTCVFHGSFTLISRHPIGSPDGEMVQAMKVFFIEAGVLILVSDADFMNRISGWQVQFRNKSIYYYRQSIASSCSPCVTLHDLLEYPSIRRSDMVNEVTAL